ncbi:MAG: tetratricopeptide repeat protein, partial [Planctomycetota bacterium]
MRVREALWTLGVLAAVCRALVPAASAQAEPAGAYDRLDNKKLAEKLTELKMTELLEAMVTRSPEGLEGKLLLIRSTRAKALACQDQGERDALLKKTADLMGEYAKATMQQKDPAGRIGHFRVRLDLVIVRGIDMVDPYAERLLYFIGSAQDEAKVRELTREAVDQLDRTVSQMEMLRDEWSPDWDRWIDQTFQKLEAMLDEAAYRGAWIRFYRAIVLPRDHEERGQLLQQAVADVRKFADAEDNDSGVKFQALVLSGMCARELGNWKAARSYFRRAQDPGASIGAKLKALFETVRIHIDQKDLTGADRQVQAFRTQAAKIPEVKKVSIDMQAALLLYKIGMVRAAAFEKADPAKYVEMRGAAGRHLVDFVTRYPAYRQTFWEVIAPLVRASDPSKMDPTMVLGLASREIARKTPEGDKRAEEMLRTVIKSDKAARATKGGALWMLALLKNRQRTNLEAGDLFRQLAENYPADVNARNAALNAVKSYDAILKKEKKSAGDMGPEFLKAYVRAVGVLVNGWGDTDAKIRSYNYELGMLYDGMGLYTKAIEAFSKIPRTSELYLPSGFRIQQLQVKQLLDAVEMEGSAREQTARGLIADLGRYMIRARQYIKSTSDASRISEVRQWGAECGMLIAQLYKEVLNDPARAMTEA